MEDRVKLDIHSIPNFKIPDEVAKFRVIDYGYNHKLGPNPYQKIVDDGHWLKWYERWWIAIKRFFGR